MNIGLSFIHKTENLTEAAIEESMDPERKNATTHRFRKNSNIQIHKESNIHRTQISRFTDLPIRTVRPLPKPLSLCLHGLSKRLTT